MDALSTGDWMYTSNMGGWMDALSRLVGWMR